MKNLRFGILGFFCLLISGKACDGETSTIQVVDAYVKSGADDSSSSYVRLRIEEISQPGDFHSTSELVLLNDCKNGSAKPQVYQNADRTIVGFIASIARDNFKINLVYFSDRGELIIDQHFNIQLSNMLKISDANARFDPSGLYLDNILGRNLSVGYKSDNGKGSFKFQVQLQPNGHLEMVPNSLKLDN